MGEWKEEILDNVAVLTINSWKVGDEKCPYIGLEHIIESGLRLNGFGSSTEVTSNKYRFTQDEFLFGKLRPYFRKVIRPKFSGICSTDIWVVKNKENVDLDFLFYLFANQDFVDIAYFGSSGTRMPRADWKFMKKTKWFIPIDLNEQKAIAAVLSSLDDKIDLLHRQNKTLEAMAETLFRQWFIEEAKEEWEEGKLGDFINIKHGYAFRGKSITTERNNQILVTPGNFKIGGGFKFGKMKYFIGTDYPNGYIFFSDDLIVTMTDLSKEGDTLGYSALIPEHNQHEVLYLHNQRVGKVEFMKDISKYFVYYLMKTDDYQWFILGGASGTSVRHTSPTSICNYPFPVPPMNRVKEFDMIVNKLISKVHKNQKQISTLEKLRDILLPKLMSGEVRVAY